MNYLIIALGNPGEQYKNTRHNAGWIAVDLAYPDLEWKENKYANAFCASYPLSAIPYTLVLAKPLTFMNESGQTVRYYIEKENIAPENIIVIYDDIDLPLGKIKISFDRGSGGHNGIKSIEDHVGGRNFIRIRIGISKVLEDGTFVKPNVLGNFEPSEIEALATLAPRIREAIETIITNGRETATGKFNAS